MTRNRRRYDLTTRQDRRRQANLFARFRLHKLSLCQHLSCMYLISSYNSPAKMAQTHEAESIIGLPTRWMKRTKSAFVSSHDMAPEVFASDQIDARLDAIVESNSFITGCIRNLLSHCGDPPPVEESNCDKLSSDSTDVDMEDAQEDSSRSDAERGCSKEQHISFIAFACNRRNNAMQHRNGLMALSHVERTIG
ncbi:BQ5605_C038g11710 [Microbotryum silenes-dioicae]|uniref:BQ5605_C038g11710 protein n=1 Tax=Microbotryum silenes-dioicae TaxID=796604 RepID=A0A2X0N8I2_9BASI|nr:BQ5605_C038g11710 [Microbotryum silenes-dioicae]